MKKREEGGKRSPFAFIQLAEQAFRQVSVIYLEMAKRNAWGEQKKKGLNKKRHELML